MVCEHGPLLQSLLFAWKRRATQKVKERKNERKRKERNRANKMECEQLIEKEKEKKCVKMDSRQ